MIPDVLEQMHQNVITGMSRRLRHPYIPTLFPVLVPVFS